MVLKTWVVVLIVFIVIAIIVGASLGIYYAVVAKKDEECRNTQANKLCPPGTHGNYV